MKKTFAWMCFGYIVLMNCVMCFVSLSFGWSVRALSLADPSTLGTLNYAQLLALGLVTAVAAVMVSFRRRGSWWIAMAINGLIMAEGIWFFVCAINVYRIHHGTSEAETQIGYLVIWVFSYCFVAVSSAIALLLPWTKAVFRREDLLPKPAIKEAI